MLNIHDDLIEKHLAEIGSNAMAVLMVLCRHIGRDRKCWPSTARIEKMAGVGETARKNATKKLEQLGYISRYRRTNEAGKYLGIGYQLHTEMANHYTPSDGNPSVEIHPMDKDLQKPSCEKHPMDYPSDGKPSVEKHPMDKIAQKPSGVFPSVDQTIGGFPPDISIDQLDKVLANKFKVLISSNDQLKIDLSSKDQEILILQKKLQQAEQAQKEIAQRLTEQTNNKKQPKKTRAKKEYIEQYKNTIGLINEICRKKLEYPSTDAKIKTCPKYRLFKARFADGATMEQVKQVIRYKNKEWGTDKYWRKFLRPQTLFARDNWTKYLDEVAESDHQSDTPISDTYRSLNQVIEENGLTHDDIFRMSNDHSHRRKITQP